MIKTWSFEEMIIDKGIRVASSVNPVALLRGRKARVRREHTETHFCSHNVTFCATYDPAGVSPVRPSSGAAP